MGVFEIIWRGGVLLVLGFFAAINLIYENWLPGILCLFIFTMFLLGTLDAWDNKKNNP
jgi:hypothetical protein